MSNQPGAAQSLYLLPILQTVYLFTLAVLGHHCGRPCGRPFPWEQGLSPGAVHGPLIAVGSLGLEGVRTSVTAVRGLGRCLSLALEHRLGT